MPIQYVQSYLAKATHALLNPLRITIAFIHSDACLYRNRTALAPWMRSFRKYVSPRLLIPSSVCLDPLECCFGTNPNHADKCLAFLNWWMSPILDTRALAVIGPIPGMSNNRLQASLWVHTSLSLWSKAYTRSSRRKNSSSNSYNTSLNIEVISLSVSPRIGRRWRRNTLRKNTTVSEQIILGSIFVQLPWG